MNILVTGASGMVGTALIRNLEALRDGKNRTRPALKIGEIFACTRETTDAQLEDWCRRAGFVFHLAGVNRPKEKREFMAGNRDLTERLLETLRRCGSRAPVMLASSAQACLCGRYAGSEYGASKLAGEQLVFAYGAETGVKTAVYRFPNLMGHSRPNYNSAVSTFCYNLAREEPITVNDPSTELELLYIDDLVEGLFDLLEGKEQRCRYEGLTPVPDPNGPFCHIPVTHRATLGQIVELLAQFRAQPVTLLMPQMPEGSFAKKLFSLYLSYLPAEKVKNALNMKCDGRGTFTELLHTKDCGQVSVNISRPGATKGQHWHNSKWEQFIVVRGRGLIRERNLSTGEVLEFEVSGDKIESVYMLPGWTHSIVNLSQTEELVTVMLCNEVFDPAHPDTFSEPV